MEQQRKKLARQREEREEEYMLKEQQLQRERQERARRDDALRKKTASMLSGLRRTQTSYHIPTAGSGGGSSGFTSYSSYSSYNSDHTSSGSGYSYSANLASKWSNVSGTEDQADQPSTTEDKKQPTSSTPTSQEDEDPVTTKPKTRRDSATPSESDSIPIRTRSPSPVQRQPSYTSTSAFHTPRHSFNDLHTPNRSDFSPFSSHLGSHGNRAYPSHSPDLLSPNYGYGGSTGGIGSGFSRSHDDLSHQGTGSRGESPEFNRRFEQEQRERKIARNNDRIKNIKVELERLGEERIRLELENQQLRDKNDGVGSSSTSSRYQSGYYDNYNSLPRSFTANTRRYTTAGFTQYRNPESRDDDSA